MPTSRRIVELPWTEQPQDASGLNRHHRAALGLVSWLPGNGQMYDPARGRLPAAEGSPAFLRSSLPNLGPFQALAWDGSNDGVDAGVVPALGDLTLVAWVDLNTAVLTNSYHGLITRGAVFENSSNFAFGFRWTGTELRAFLYARSGGGALSGAETAGSSYPTGWVRVVATRTGSATRFYANGALHATGAGSTGSDGGQALRFGRPNSFTPTDSRWPTAAFDLRVYNRVWSADEVAADYSEAPWLLFEPLPVPIPRALPSGLSFTLADAGGGTELVSVRASASANDAGAGADGFAGRASVPMTDAGSAGDALVALARLLQPDVAAATDALSMRAAAQLADAGAGTSAAGLAVRVVLSDTLTGAEALLLSARLAMADAGSAVENLVLLTSTLLKLVDSGAGTDAIAAAMRLAAGDAAQGLDATRLLALTRLVESGSGATTLRVNASVNLADLGGGADAVSLLQAVLKQVADAGAGLDGMRLGVTVRLTEAGAGAELLALAALLRTLDQGSGVDVSMRLGSDGARLVRIDFAFAARRMLFRLN